MALELHQRPETGAPDPLDIRPMIADDLAGVMEIERAVYSAPWSRAVFLQDLTNNGMSRYLIGELRGQLIGYAGIWIFEQVGHVTTVAVDPRARRHGYGSQLLEAILVEGRKAGVIRFTLEVRVSNTAAQAMYRQYGFYGVGVRPRYYQDDKEDALIMWTDPETEGYERGWTG